MPRTRSTLRAILIKSEIRQNHFLHFMQFCVIFFLLVDFANLISVSFWDFSFDYFIIASFTSWLHSSQYFFLCFTREDFFHLSREIKSFPFFFVNSFSTQLEKTSFISPTFSRLQRSFLNHHTNKIRPIALTVQLELNCWMLNFFYPSAWLDILCWTCLRIIFSLVLFNVAFALFKMS